MKPSAVRVTCWWWLYIVCLLCPHAAFGKVSPYQLQRRLVELRGGGNPKDDESSIFGSLIRQSGKALAATARGSTRVAADLVRPKDVDWKELVGYWRLDVALDNDSSSILTIQLTPNRRVRFTDAAGVDH